MKCIQCKKDYNKGFSVSFCSKKCKDKWLEEHKHIPYKSIRSGNKIIKHL